MPINFDEVQDYDSFLADRPEQTPEVFQQEQEEELGFWGTVGDIAAAPVRGVAGAAEGLLEIGNIFGLDYDVPENLGLGESETFAGSAVEGITQFVSGFLPGIGIAGRIGAAAGWAGKTGKVAQTVARLHDSKRKLSALAVLRGSEAIKYTAAGAIADFTVFDGHEERLSNLIESFPELANPVTEFLAADEDDSEIEGRLKAAVEGAGLGFAIDGLLIGFKAMRAGISKLPDKQVASVAAEKKAAELAEEAASKGADDVVEETTKKGVDDALEESTESTVKDADEVIEEGATKEVDEFSEEATERALAEEEAALDKLTVEEIEASLEKSLFNLEKASDTASVRQALIPIVAHNRALRKIAETTVDTKTMAASAREVRDDIQNGAGVKLGSDEELEAILKEGGDALENLQHSMDVTLVVRDELHNRTKILITHTKKAVDPAQGTKMDMVNFLKQRMQLEDLTTMVRGLGGAWGRGLRSMGLTAPVLRRDLDKLSKESLETNPSLADDIIDAAGGEAVVKAEMEKFLAAAETGGNMAALSAARGKVTKTGAVIEYWMNAVLSGPVTSAVNMTSAILTTMLAPAEKAIGHALTGQMHKVGDDLARYAYLASSIGDALNVAKLAFREGEAILDPTMTTVETAGRKYKVTEALLETRLNNSTMGQEASRWLGSTVNLPSRFLSATDEFFKQINYRSVMKSELAAEAASKGITNPKLIAEYVEENFNRLVTDGQFLSQKGFRKEVKNLSDDDLLAALQKTDNHVLKLMKDGKFNRALAETGWVRDRMNHYSPMAEKARSVARDVTFTTPLSNDRGLFIGVSKSASDFVNKHPIARFVMPFVRTPANIIKHFMDRVPLLGEGHAKAVMDWNKQLHHSKAEVRADAIGRLMTGSMFVTTGILAASNGGITGGGPTDRNRRRMMEDAGWQPYSVKIGDSYISYRRLDPFAMTFGMIADLTEIFMEGDETVRETAGDYIAALTMSVARNLTSKTYLTGVTRLSDALTKPETAGSSYLRSTAGSFVPNFLTQMNRSFEDENKDVKNWIDTFRTRIPGFSQDVAPQRNMFGEPIVKHGAVGPDFVSPFDYSETTSDVLKKELAEIGHPFTPPRSLKNGVELREAVNQSGQSAYDRWLELHGEVKIGGRSMRQAITRLIKSRKYKQLPYEAIEGLENSPRVREINKILSKYRAKAFSQMLREFPDVRQRDEINLLIKQARRTGQSYEELLALANQ